MSCWHFPWTLSLPLHHELFEKGAVSYILFDSWYMIPCLAHSRYSEIVCWMNEYWHEFGQTLEDGEGQGSLLLQSMGLQRVRHDLATEQQELLWYPQGKLICLVLVCLRLIRLNPWVTIQAHSLASESTVCGVFWILQGLRNKGNGKKEVAEPSISGC